MTFPSENTIPAERIVAGSIRASSFHPRYLMPPVQFHRMPLDTDALHEAIYRNLNPILNDLVFKEAEMPSSRHPEAQQHLSGKKEFFVIWCPTSNLPPQQTFGTEEEAWEVCESMSQKHDGDRFFVMKALGSCAVEKPVVRRSFQTKDGE